MTTISEIQKAVIPIARAYGVKRLYLFGSYAKGTADRESDIDLLVEKGKPLKSGIKISFIKRRAGCLRPMGMQEFRTASINFAGIISEKANDI